MFSLKRKFQKVSFLHLLFSENLPEGQINSFDFSADGKYLMAVLSDNKVLQIEIGSNAIRTFETLPRNCQV